MKNLKLSGLFAAAFLLAIAALAGAAQAKEPIASPEQVMTKFLKAFVAYDYDTCRALLAPGASIAITRRYRGGPYEHVYQKASDWLNEVGDTGVKELEGFSVDIHETVGLTHEHGATVIARFTATAGAKSGRFENLGFDTGSLINTPDGWRILHYSSFEDFRWHEGEGAE